MHDLICQHLLDKATEVSTSGIMQYKHTFHYVSTPTETAAILTRVIFWFHISDTKFIAKTINDGNTDLAQYPAAKV